MQKRDAWWLLSYPLYQLLGTIRHEGSHALVAWLQGYRITRFVFWPADGKFGYVSWDGPTSAIALAAPYLVDLLTFALCFTLCYALTFRRRWVWLNLVILGIISPLANSLFNYIGGWRGPNDVGRLLTMWPPAGVHLYFVATLLLYAAGLVVLWWAGRPKMVV